MVLAGLAGCTAALVPAVADACGGLIGENGTIELVRTTTLAAYSDGIERYVTAFEFTGEGESVGSIVPLPDVPTSVERGGDWTLQRLALEVAPPATGEGDVAAEAAVSRTGGGGDRAGDADRRPRHHRAQGRRRRGRAVGARERLPPDAGRTRGPRLLRRTAARCSWPPSSTPSGRSSSARAPVTARRSWRRSRPTTRGSRCASSVSAWTTHRDVEADVFLLTDRRPELLAGGPGLTLERSEAASSGLLADLRSDVGMEWVPDSMWLSFLQLDAEAGDLDYDLAVSQEPAGEPSITDAGVAPASVVPVRPAPSERPWWPIAARQRRRRRRPRAGDAQGGVVRYLLAVLASLTVAVATTAAGYYAATVAIRRPGGARSGRRHGPRRRRAQPLRAVVRPCRRGHRGPLRRQQRATRSTTS